MVSSFKPISIHCRKQTNNQIHPNLSCTYARAVYEVCTLFILTAIKSSQSVLICVFSCRPCRSLHHYAYRTQTFIWHGIHCNMRHTSVHNTVRGSDVVCIPNKVANARHRTRRCNRSIRTKIAHVLLCLLQSMDHLSMLNHMMAYSLLERSMQLISYTQHAHTTQAQKIPTTI